MSPEQVKESIKLNTGILKFYFIIFVGIATGVVTLGSGGDYSTPRKIFIILGGIGLVASLLLIGERILKIRSLIKQL